MKPSSASPSSSPAAESSAASPSAPSSTAGVAAMTAAEDPSPPPSTSQEMMAVDRRGSHAASCRWTVPGFPRIKARALWSRYFDVGGYDCRLLVYPRGDSQALPGYFSVYLQVVDPRRGTASSASNRWDCFASYRLSVLHPSDESKSVHRDSWHRFSSKKKSHGWCDFTPSSTLLDHKLGFLSPGNNDSITVSADVLVLDEAVSFSGDETGGKFTWRVRNFSLFRDMVKTQKIMSPVFPAGDCNLRISVYQSSVSGVDHLSMCLESKDTDKASTSTSMASGGGGTGSGGGTSNGGGGASGSAAMVVQPSPADRSCWCLFRMLAMNQKPGAGPHVHRDSYGRFAADSKGGDNTSLGWNDYMRMADFVALDAGFVVDDMAVFSTSFHVIRESCSFSKSVVAGGRGGGGGQRKVDGHVGKFTWRIENFTRLKDLLKKRKITGLCVKSRRFQIGNRDCRLIVYPRGSSESRRGTVIFIHGAPTQSYSYRVVMSQMADSGFHCLAPDWIGFGFSDKPQPGYGFSYTGVLILNVQTLSEEEYHVEFDKVLSVLNVKSPFVLVVQGFLVGSYGLTWALKNPSRVSKLVVLNSPLTSASPVPSLFRNLRLPLFGEFTCQNAVMAERFIEAGSAYVLKLEKADVYRLPYLASSGPGFALLEAARKANFQDISKRVETGFSSGRWSQPILLAWGISDKYLPQSEAEKFQKGNSSLVKLKLIEGAGHMPQEDCSISHLLEDKQNKLATQLLKQQE
ncbi:hypothetical protein QJS10_CPB13g00338 [Acorus calamus]|uniref:MATH domain-containing protein n=1 Tax=Acorus calamus TaxID=4465 RepID=A0AAV9DKX0_ACOCL|nr:hypothetical protein QJS10_CPB13g00338 [Acorus calamus]